MVSNYDLCQWSLTMIFTMICAMVPDSCSLIYTNPVKYLLKKDQSIFLTYTVKIYFIKILVYKTYILAVDIVYTTVLKACHCTL
jgi:hypothetical protein